MNKILLIGLLLASCSPGKNKQTVYHLVTGQTVTQSKNGQWFYYVTQSMQPSQFTNSTGSWIAGIDPPDFELITAKKEIQEIPDPYQTDGQKGINGSDF